MKPLLLALLVGSACASVHALPLTYDNLVRKYSAKYGHDPLLIHAQIQQESGHNASICSGAGACGLMQIMPLTAPELGLTAAERFNPEKILLVGRCICVVCSVLITALWLMRCIRITGGLAILANTKKV